MSAIRFESVSKWFPNSPRPAVDDCSLAVEAGALVVFLGPSGCGKTTLLKMVNRLYEPTSGRILVDGTAVRDLEVTALRRQIGYVIQQVGLFPHMTVAENVGLVPRLLGWPRSRIDSRTEELLELVELPAGEYGRRYPSQLSGGQQQRVGVARALAANPGILLMDEPFGAIDSVTRAGLQDKLLRLQADLRKTILFVTHDVDEALRLADVIVVIRDGRVVQQGKPEEILTQPASPFVRDLVGADDLFRRLGLLRVSTAMSALPPSYQRNGGPTVQLHDDLRKALSILLQTGAPFLTVLDGESPAGILDLERVGRITLRKADA